MFKVRQSKKVKSAAEVIRGPSGLDCDDECDSDGCSYIRDTCKTAV
jgi:hypothetical protein